MAWEFDNKSPIFLQISKIITNDILTQKYQKGEKLPTVRELSVIAGVNPNTMQKALVEIENTGMIFTKRGDGRYVSHDLTVFETEKNKKLQEHAFSFVSYLTNLGLSEEEIIDLIKNQIERVKE